MLTIYKASAGSGKTYNLVFEYIKNLLCICNRDNDISLNQYTLNHPDFNRSEDGKRGAFLRNRHRSILAITFTNKATEEMKQRIMGQLNALARHENYDKGYSPKLEKLTGANDKQVQEAAKEALKDILTDYQYFNVSTIDSFFQSVLRSFAFELDQTSDYEISLTTSSAIKESLAMMLTEFNYNNSADNTDGSEDFGESFTKTRLGRWLISRYRKNMTKGKTEMIFNINGYTAKQMVSLINTTFNETFKNHNDEFKVWANIDEDQSNADNDPVEKFRNYISKCIKAKVDELVKKTNEADAYVKENYTLPKHKFDPTETKICKTYYRVAKGFIKTEDISDLAGEPKTYSRLNLDKLDNSAKWYTEIVDPDKVMDQKNLFGADDDKKWKKFDEQKYEELKEYIRQYLKDCIDIHGCLTSLNCISDSLGDLSILIEMIKYLNKYREDNNIVFLADTNELLRRIIGADELPFVYERLGVVLQHFLIDEFQDTSRMQWENLSPLVENSMAEGNDNLIIGDVKQSIYRFRNADSSLLDHDVQESFDYGRKGSDVELRGVAPVGVLDDSAPQELRDAQKKAAEENTNWRSAAEVVQFNNSLFKAMGEWTEADGFESVVQQIAKSGENSIPGYVHLIPISKWSTPDSKNAEGTPSDDDGDSSQDSDKSSNDSDGDSSSDTPIYTIAEAKRYACMVAEIKRQRESGYDFKDIMILSRTNDEGSKIVRYLLNECEEVLPGLRIASAEGLMIVHSRAVRTVIAMLNLIAEYYKYSADAAQQPAKKKKRISQFETSTIISRYEMMVRDYDLNAMPDEDRNKLIRDTLLEVVKQDPDNTDDLVKNIVETKASTLVALVETVIEKAISEKDRKSEYTYLAALMDTVIEFSNTQDATLNGFLKWWELNKSTITVAPGEDIDAITVMTVHRAKGLERPCVHVVFRDNEQFVGNNPLRDWFPTDELFSDPSLPKAEEGTIPPMIHAELRSGVLMPGNLFKKFYESDRKKVINDTINMTYVALTRAVNELIVYYSPDPPKNNKNSLPDELKYMGVTIFNSIKKADKTIDGTNTIVNLADLLSENTIAAPEAEVDSEADGEYEDTQAEEFAGEFKGELILGEPTVKAQRKAESAKSDDSSKTEPITPDAKALTQTIPIDTDSKSLNARQLFSLDISDEDFERLMGDIEKQHEEPVDIEEQMMSKAAPAPASAKSRGIKLHAVMAALDRDLNVAQAVRIAAKSLKEAAKRNGESMTDAELEKYVDDTTAKLSAAISRPNAARYIGRWFKDMERAVCEWPIYKPSDNDSEYDEGAYDDTREETRRPDRVVFNPDGSIDVVDYKFGNQANDRTHNSSNHRQVREYIDLLSDAYPDKTVRGYLWHVDKDIIEEVATLGI